MENYTSGRAHFKAARARKIYIKIMFVAAYYRTFLKISFRNGKLIVLYGLG